ncbi:Rab geranylgeranyltransferase [Blastocladiella emersonii ATCC 22665]|nr:Rab geranylgeranyltransferase [Blastocladiella emersonii ATCC 22665]
MHGRKIIHMDAAAEAARKIVMLEQIKEYRVKLDEFMRLRAAKDSSETALASTTTMLSAYPDHYTAWNYRRELLPAVYSGAALAQALQSDLVWLTKTVQPANPKSYWVWNHRRWCLDTLASLLTAASKGDDVVAMWRNELLLVNKFLELDARNFHAWGYRREVIHHLESLGVFLQEAEWAFTASKIAQNFSNYSAWHYRSHLLPEWLAAKNISFDSVLDDELELLNNAFFTEPNDQSSWLYFRWIMAKAARELDADRVAAAIASQVALLDELLDMEPTCKWIMTCLVFLLTLDPARSAEKAARVQSLVSKLQEIDPFRRDYYATLLLSDA